MLENQYSLSAEEAFEAAVDVFRAELSLLEEESARLRDGGVSATLDRYLVGLEDWLHGNLAWSSALSALSLAFLPLTHRQTTLRATWFAVDPG